MSLFRPFSIVAVLAFFAAPALGSEAVSEEAAPMTEETTETAAQPAQEPTTEATDETAEVQEPKMTCRYVPSATSRVSRRVCSPAK